MINLITLQQAKTQVRVTDDAKNYDIEQKVAQASAIVMNYIKKTTVPEEWVNNSTSPITYEIPADIQMATLLVVGELYMNRESGAVNIFSDSLKDVLAQYWDPALA